MSDRFVIDPDIALRISAGGVVPRADVQLVAPTLLRSDVLEILYGRVRRGEMPEAEALALHAAFSRLKVRYLGDKVLRRRAWSVAAESGAETTALAEYVAPTLLQADALVTETTDLAALAEGVVRVVGPEALSG